ncbi:MAG TPA: AMP-binding protein [Acidimicrobiales bacterium]|nr:AMP-binding protein [Acidimicrobiales bacterium]
MTAAPSTAAPSTIPALLLAAARRFGPTPAVDDGERRLSFTDLADAARAGAGALVRRGVGPGDRVALWGANSVDWVTADLAVLCAGGIVVPVNHRYRPAEAADIVTRAGCRLVIADGPAGGPANAADGPAGGPAGTADGPAGGRDLAAEAAGFAGDRSVLGFGDWRAAVEGGDPDDPAVRERLAAVGPADVSHVQFTSGTTGRPKGALLTHGAMTLTTATWVRVVGLRPGDGYPVVAPFSHIGGHKTAIVAALASGATLRPMPALDVDALVDLVGRGEVSFLQGPPALFHAVLTEVGRRGTDTSAVRSVVTGAAVVPPELVRRLYDVLGVEAVITSYGITEATGVCTMTRPDDPVGVVAGTCGRPVDGVTVRIGGPDGRDVDAGQPGEVLVRGPNLMAGYLDDPAATAEAVDPDGWLHTGDVGTVDADGNLRIVDRLKDMVVVGGLNVYPAEVERVLAAHRSVDQAAVVGVPDHRMGEVPLAFVVPAAGPAGRPVPVDPAALEAHCRERLAGFKVPRRYRVVDALPVNPAGKVDKPALRARAAEAA